MAGTNGQDVGDRVAAMCIAELRRRLEAGWERLRTDDLDLVKRVMDDAATLLRRAAGGEAVAFNEMEHVAAQLANLAAVVERDVVAESLAAIERVAQRALAIGLATLVA
jgi:hypothetical protein